MLSESGTHTMTDRLDPISFRLWLEVIAREWLPFDVVGIAEQNSPERKPPATLVICQMVCGKKAAETCIPCPHAIYLLTHLFVVIVNGWTV